MEEMNGKSDLFLRNTLYGLRRGGNECSIWDSSGICWNSMRFPIFEERVFLQESGIVILEERVMGCSEVKGWSMVFRVSLFLPAHLYSS